MRICYIVDACNVHGRRWIQPFITLGHEIHVLSYVSCSEPIPGLAGYVDLTSLTNTPKIRFAQWGWWINRYVRRLRPHVLHAHQIPGAGWLGAMANYHPFVLSAWGSDLLVEPNRSRFRRQLLRLVLRQSDLLTVPSPVMASAARDLNVPHHCLHIVPWGVETDVFSHSLDDRRQTRHSLGLDTEAPILLAPRRIAPQYNIHTMLAALESLVGQYPSLHLLLVRYDPDLAYLAKIEAEIASSGLHDHISWLPAQNSFEDMACLYRMADIVLSIPTSEGYGSTVYEAMACGTPVIISDLPVFDDELIDGVNAIKVPVADIAATSAAVARLLDDQELYRRIATNGLEVIREKRASDRVKQVESLYESVAAGKFADA